MFRWRIRTKGSAEEGSRTPMPLRAEDFESSASASFATSASAQKVAASHMTRQRQLPRRVGTRMLDDTLCLRGIMSRRTKRSSISMRVSPSTCGDECASNACARSVCSAASSRMRYASTCGCAAGAPPETLPCAAVLLASLLGVPLIVGQRRGDGRGRRLRLDLADRLDGQTSQIRILRLLREGFERG